MPQHNSHLFPLCATVIHGAGLLRSWWRPRGPFRKPEMAAICQQKMKIDVLIAAILAAVVGGSTDVGSDIHDNSRRQNALKTRRSKFVKMSAFHVTKRIAFIRRRAKRRADFVNGIRTEIGVERRFGSKHEMA
uniref:Secreted protein n=1 Tax=Angiostrongylus cantonensis TaxID=6313 RepID=A0A0K0DKU2_ANGCA